MVRRRPSWLYTALIALLAVLGLSLWLAAGHEKRVRAPAASPPQSPPVIYEDMQRLSALKVLGAVRERKQRTGFSRHGIALIIDDVGYNMDALRRIMALPYPVAVSIIPNAPYATHAAKMAHKAGLVVMLHLPMEPANPKYQRKMDTAFLRAGMEQSDIRRTMLSDLSHVPYAVGVNNHMGSRLTTMEEPMRWVMDICRERGLFFVDSRTTKDSVAARLARTAGLSWGARRVFLDDSLDADDLEASWQLAKRRLHRGGGVIVIAHPHRETLDFLEQQLKEKDTGQIVQLKRLLAVGQSGRFVAGRSPYMQ